MLFNFANEEIWMSLKFQNYIYYFEFSCFVFPRSQDKRAGMSKMQFGGNYK